MTIPSGSILTARSAGSRLFEFDLRSLFPVSRTLFGVRQEIQEICRLFANGSTAFAALHVLLEAICYVLTGKSNIPSDWRRSPSLKQVEIRMGRIEYQIEFRSMRHDTRHSEHRRSP